MSSLCDISIIKRKLCLIMQVEMAKKTQGCISYGFLSAKQRKDSFVCCYYKGWHPKAPLPASCVWNSLSLGLILCFIYFVVNVIIIYKCKEIGYEQSKSLCLVCQHHCFFCWFFFSVQQAQQTSPKKGTAFSLLKKEKDRLKVARNPMRNHRAFTRWAPSKKNICAEKLRPLSW